MGGCSIIPYLVFDITPSISSIPVVTLGTTTSKDSWRILDIGVELRVIGGRTCCATVITLAPHKSVAHSVKMLCAFLDIDVPVQFS